MATPPPASATPSLHDALPICSHLSHKERKYAVPSSFTFSPRRAVGRIVPGLRSTFAQFGSTGWSARRDRKSTRLNSSHLVISYAVSCWEEKTTYPMKRCLLWG